MILEVILLHSKIFNNNSMALCHTVTAHNHNGKQEVDHPDTKATIGLHIIIKHIQWRLWEQVAY